MDNLIKKGAEKKALLIVSFGTSYKESREKAIGAVERALANAFPDYDFFRSFTSKTILRLLRERDGLQIADVKTALQHLTEEGYTTVLIQPTYMMSGIEYDETAATVAAYKSLFQHCAMGAPALSSEKDFTEMVRIVEGALAGRYDDRTVVVMMGHGSEHEANFIYEKLEGCFKTAGFPNFLVGTVEAMPSMFSVIDKVKRMSVEKILLLPLMIVAGDHAANDMAGDNEDSWKNSFEAAGYQVECIMQGLGEYKGIQELFVRHAGTAADRITGET